MTRILLYLIATSLLLIALGWIGVNALFRETDDPDYRTEKDLP